MTTNTYTSDHARRWARRERRRKRRPRMVPESATAISTRTRWRLWPVIRKITRWHRYEGYPKPRCKWHDYEDEVRDE